MGLLDRFKKTKQGEREQNLEVDHLDADITEDEAIRRAKAVFNQKRLFILLSTKHANYLQGISIPFVCQLPENGKKGIVVFSREEYARKYIENHQFEILDGVYPIGVLEADDKLNGLNTIISTANAMNLDFLDYNPGFNDDTLGCSIKWFMQMNDISPEVSILMSEKEMKETTESNKRFPVRFNPVKFYQYDQSYMIDENRSKAILSHVFECDNSEKAFLIFKDETLFECCHTTDYICTQMIPTAEQQGKTEHVQFFKSVLGILELVIIGKLDEQPALYTLIDPNTDQIIVKDNIAYILYTDRFKYMGKYKYQELPKEKGIEWLKEKTGLQDFMVTDGPHGMAFIHLN